MNMNENNHSKMKPEQPGSAGKFKLAEALRELLEKKISTPLQPLQQGNGCRCTPEGIMQRHFQGYPTH
jgi:hypothetical protein